MIRSILARTCSMALASAALAQGGCAATRPPTGQAVSQDALKREIPSSSFTGRSPQEIADELACRLWLSTSIEMMQDGPCCYAGTVTTSESGLLSSSTSVLRALTVRVDPTVGSGSLRASLQFPMLKSSNLTSHEVEVLTRYAAQLRLIWNPVVDATTSRGPVAGLSRDDAMLRFREQFAREAALTSAPEASPAR